MKKHKSELGSTIIMTLVIFLVLFVWGMLVLKTERNYSLRSLLSLEVVSASNAANNASPIPGDMFEVACNHLSQVFDFSGLGGCDQALFPVVDTIPVNHLYKDVPARDGSFTCRNIDFRYDPGLLTAVDLKQRELCIDITECEQIGAMILPWVSSEPYKFGASACAGLKPAAVMIALDTSKKMYRTFQNNLNPVPPPFLDTASGYTGMSSGAFQSSMKRNSLPMVYDSHLPGIDAQFLKSPMQPYKFPFSTKEVSTIRSIPNQYGNTAATIPTGINAPAFINSMPDVVPQTNQLNPTWNDPLGPDPIQYVSEMPPVGSAQVSTWAGLTTLSGSVAQNARWRSGILTMNELAQRCFNPRKLWTQKIAQQVMYMLDDYEIPFGTMTFSNWIIGLMPLISYNHRLDTNWPVPGNPLSTLTTPLMGPDPISASSLPGGNPMYIERQFGNFNNTLNVSGGLLDRDTNFSLLYQPMSICARETTHQYLPGSGPHVFTAQPNPFDLNMQVAVDNTRCADTSAHTIPTLDAIRANDGSTLNFIFRSRSRNPVVNDPFPAFGQPLANRIYSGDCFGDLQTDNSNQTPNSSDTLSFNTNTTFCGSNPADRLPNWMRRDRADAVNNMTNGSLNIDDVTVTEVTDPYRICPNPSEIDSTLSNLNVSVAVSTIRAGGFTKSGWPLMINANVIPATHSGNPAPSARSRYFTLPTQWDPTNAAQSVYPIHEPGGGGADALISGALLNSFNVLTDSAWIPDPTKLRRIVVLFSDGFTTLSMQDALAGNYDSAWFQSDPGTSVLPTGTPGSPVPFYTGVLESLQLIHTMAKDGIMVVVVTLDDTFGTTTQHVRQVFSAGLREPIGEAPPQSNRYRFALCKPCGGAAPFTGDCTNSLDSEPGITSPSPATCMQDPPAKNVYEIRVPRQGEEPWPQYQHRMFRRVTVELNRILNRYTLTK